MTHPIVDSHLHFWDPNSLRYDWLASLPPLNQPMTPTDLNQATAQSNLEKIVFVQADCSPAEGLAEVEWVTTLAQADPRIQGIVAFAPLETGDAVTANLEQLAQYPLVKGVRRLIQSEDAGFATHPDFIRGVQQLAAFDFSFDICIIHHQMGDVIHLVKQCPDIQFVLDHCGKPAIKSGETDPWMTQFATLATFPNVCCKLSGLLTEADLTDWSASDLDPYIDHALTSFGPDRLMFGSDWPVLNLAADYKTWLEIAQAKTSHFSREAQDNIFFQNAARFYKLGDS
ncbi:MAG: amidohydrolase family protein [Chloroflexota bacterium]